MTLTLQRCIPVHCNIGLELGTDLWSNVVLTPAVKCCFKRGIMYSNIVVDKVNQAVIWLRISGNGIAALFIILTVDICMQYYLH